MKAKLLELRDDGTFIPLLCVDMNPGDESITFSPLVVVPRFSDDRESYDRRRYLLRRCGYPCDGRPNIAISCLDASGGPLTNDPFWWGGFTGARTYPVAHRYIIENWDKLKDGDVVDVEFILGEKPVPKVSERESAPL